MRWSWLRAALLGVIIGPAPFPADPVDSAETDADVPEVELPAPETKEGRAVRGTNFHVWDEDAREAAEWAVELLRSGGEITAPGRWGDVAARTATLPATLTRELEGDLTAWIEASDADARVPELGFLICLLPALDRTCLISSWATSPNERVRRALARALCAPFEAVGVRGAIDVLQSDPSAEVRQLARSAAARRRDPARHMA